MNNEKLNTIDEALLDGVSGGGGLLGNLICAPIKLAAHVVQTGVSIVGGLLSCLLPKRAC